MPCKVENRIIIPYWRLVNTKEVVEHESDGTKVHVCMSLTSWN